MLNDKDQELLERIKLQMGIVADISRAEVLLYGPLESGQTTVLAHNHPHSVAPAYLHIYTGRQISKADMPMVIKTLSSGRRHRRQDGMFGQGFGVMTEAWPVFAPDHSRRVIGAISVDISLIEHERQRRRDRIFQKALRQIHFMLTRGMLNDAEKLSEFGESEGMILADDKGDILYVSGVAANLYRRLGYLDSLVGRRLDSLATQDDKLFARVVDSLRCVERESEDGGRSWIRKAIPMLTPRTLENRLRQALRAGSDERSYGALIMVCDITEDLRQEQEIRVKNAMIQEIHHRVKNNLQTISALLRIQTRRLSENEEASIALNDAIRRIQSVAVIHEFLSDNEAWTINVKDVCQRIINQTQQGILWSLEDVSFAVHGPSIWLPSRQATACALVLNELLQNALEHGFENKHKGAVDINLIDEDETVIITVHDDGQGLPADFNPDMSGSLGLQIAKTLVTEDLQGELTLQNDNGTTARMQFPKAIFGTEEGFND